MRVSIDGLFIEVELVLGRARLSYIDEGNQTQVVDLGEESIIYDSARRKIK